MKTSEHQHKIKYWSTEESFTSLNARPILICHCEQFEKFQERIETHQVHIVAADLLFIMNHHDVSVFIEL